MKLNNWSPADHTALRVFFDAGQTWPFVAIDTAVEAPAQALRNWIEDSPAPRRHPIILPAFRPGQAEPEWFAIAFGEAQAEELRLELNAFLGPVGSDYRGRRAVLNPADTIDSAALQWSGGPYIYRFNVLPGSRTLVRGALERLRQVWRLRPKRASYVFRTTAALLREFFTALTNNDPIASQRWLAEIGQSGRLSAENLRFLEIERLGAHGYWDQLALHPQLGLLVTIRRPRRITGLLIESLWRAELASFLTQHKPADAVTYMREKFLPRYEGLLRSRGAMNKPSVVLTFLLTAVAMSPPRREQVAILQAELALGSPERDFANEVVKLAPVDSAPMVVDPLARMRECMTAKDFDSAWRHALGLPNSEEICELRLDCAAEIYTVAVARVALDGLTALPALERDRLMSRRRLMMERDELERLLATSFAAEPTDWESWLTAVTEQPEWPGALTVAQSGREEWAIAPYQNDPARVRRLASRIQSLPLSVLGTVRYALPHFSAFFLEEEARGTVFAPLYQSIHLLLAMDEQFGSEDWILAQNLFNAALESGLNAGVYSELVEAQTLIWQNRGEIARLDWALDQLDALICSAAVAPPSREAFFKAVWLTINQNSRRVSNTHRELFRLLCADLGHEAEFAALPPPRVEEERQVRTDLSALQGKIIGIYTLTESAGQRAKKVMETLFPDIEVRLNHDHTGTERLRALARGADYFLVTTRSAKHSATDFIKAERPKHLSELIYPQGKGSSSIVSALRALFG